MKDTRKTGRRGHRTELDKMLRRASRQAKKEQRFDRQVDFISAFFAFYARRWELYGRILKMQRVYGISVQDIRDTADLVDRIHSIYTLTQSLKKQG